MTFIWYPLRSGILQGSKWMDVCSWYVAFFFHSVTRRLLCFVKWKEREKQCSISFIALSGMILTIKESPHHFHGWVLHQKCRVGRCRSFCFVQEPGCGIFVLGAFLPCVAFPISFLYVWNAWVLYVGNMVLVFADKVCSHGHFTMGLSFFLAVHILQKGFRSFCRRVKEWSDVVNGSNDKLPC